MVASVYGQFLCTGSSLPFSAPIACRMLVSATCTRKGGDAGCRGALDQSTTSGSLSSYDEASCSSCVSTFTAGHRNTRLEGVGYQFVALPVGHEIDEASYGVCTTSGSLSAHDEPTAIALLVLCCRV